MVVRYFSRIFCVVSGAVILLTAIVPLSYAAFFSDSFESGDLSHTENGVRWSGTNTGAGDSMTVSTDRAHTGSHSAKFHFAAGANGDDAWSELRFNFGSPKTDVYIRFFIWFPTNFVVRNDPPTNNKIIVLCATNYNDPFGDGMEFNYSPNGVRFVEKTYQE